MIGKNNEVTITLEKDEALVLFEFLIRINNKLKDSKSNLMDIFEDQSEQKALWIMEAYLEKSLTEPFMTNYLEIIKEARNRLRD